MNDSKLIFSFRYFPGVSVEEASVQEQLVMGRDEGENKGVKNSLKSFHTISCFYHYQAIVADRVVALEVFRRKHLLTLSTNR